MVSGSALALERVSFRYGDRLVLDDVSFAVTDGRLLGLLGPNGSGKSTAVRLAAGLLPPASGKVLLGGQPLSSFGRGEIARRVAVVPQAGHLPEDFTGGEIVLAGRAPHLGRFGGASAADREAVRHALTLVDAASLAGRRAGELSGGERQRLLLARALAQEPEVLLLDEPTAHLDLHHQLALLDRVRALARDGLAVLAVFHDLNLAAEYCDELVLLRDGRIQAQGVPEAVLTAARIAAVYDVTVPMLRHPQSGRPVMLVPGVRPLGESSPEMSPRLLEHPSPQPLSPCAGRGARVGYASSKSVTSVSGCVVSSPETSLPAEAPRPAHGERGWGEGCSRSWGEGCSRDWVEGYAGVATATEEQSP